MNILQQPDNFCFTSALKDIIIESAEAINVSFSISGSAPFLEEIYYPDNDNKIYIREMDKLFLPLISKVSLKEDFAVHINGVSLQAATTLTFTLLYCTCEINRPAAEFMAGHFLTTVREKEIYANQKEYLSLYAAEPTNLNLIALYQSGQRADKTFAIETINQAITLDVSPNLFDHPEQIKLIVANCGARNITYYIRPVPPAGPVQFLFLNGFGVKETFVPAGVVNRENKYDNKTGYFAGRFKKYDVELTKEYTANTGILTESSADWLESLFTSPDVYLIDGDNSLSEIVVTEATVKRSSARDALPSYEFKYRLSKRNHHEFKVKNRIFDYTFDYTFN